MKFSSFKNWLVEKFTEDDVDPVKSMGIGAKVVYYEFKPYTMLAPSAGDRYYDLIITGNTFNIKDLIKRAGFKWSDVNKGWRSKTPKRLNIWQKQAPELFKQIEKNSGYVIEKRKNPDNPDSPAIEGWDISEYPHIDDGIGQKVYIKLVGDQFPVVILMGKGTYTSRELLKYFKFRFDKEKHGWVKSYNKSEIDEIVTILKQSNYEIIDYRNGR
jgi:hypothetical protein